MLEKINDKIIIILLEIGLMINDITMIFLGLNPIMFAILSIVWFIFIILNLINLKQIKERINLWNKDYKN